jgi:hypothetical protein
MIVMLTVVAALPLGLLVRSRTAAFLAYGLAFAHVFTFQTAQLVLEATRGSDDAFGDLSSEDWNWFGDTIGDFTFTTAIYLIGLGLVFAGIRLRTRRERTRAAVVVP